MFRIIPTRATLFLTIFTFIIFSPLVSLAGPYQVTRIIDGDTIKVDDGKQKETIRLVGIDAPEVSHTKNQSGQPFSQTATKHLNSLVLNQTVNIRAYGQDKYGRVLGEVFLGNRNINLEMVKAGLAEVYRGTPAQGQDLEPYWIAENEARAASRGMWVQGGKYISPREWRKTHPN